MIVEKTIRMIAIVTACVLQAGFAQEEQPPSPKTEAPSLSWHTEADAAKAEAEKTSKPIFLYFTADWCHFCHKMEDDTLKTSQVSKYLKDNFVLYKIDYDANKDLVAKYRIQGVPAMLMADPTLEHVEKTSGFIPLDVFVAWAEYAAGKVSPKAIAAEQEAAKQFVIDTRNSFREGLTEHQYEAINEFYNLCAKKDTRALDFAKNHLVDEVKNHPGRFSRFLRNEKLHVRILTTNAFAKIYGSEFNFDPWDMTVENTQQLDAFLKQKNISSLLEDLINF